MRILFLHGWQSAPGGMKPTFLAQHGHEVINPALPDEDMELTVRIAQAEFDKHKPTVVVGSSRGSAVAMNINSGDARLVLLCPAWKKYGTARTIKADSVILHSRADDVVPPGTAKNWSGTAACQGTRWSRSATITGLLILNRWRRCSKRASMMTTMWSRLNAKTMKRTSWSETGPASATPQR
jgi:hypothetical protein